MQIMLQVTQLNLRPNPLPENCDERLIKLMTICWRAQPTDRPSMEEIHHILESIGKTLKNGFEISFSERLDLVKRFREDQKLTSTAIRFPKVFLSYSWGNKEKEKFVQEKLAVDLKRAGIEVLLDIWDNMGNILSSYFCSTFITLTF